MITRAKLGADFLRKNGWGAAHREFLQGDASSRKYERVSLGEKRALFVDSPGKSGHALNSSGKTYSDTAKLATNILPFIAIDHLLRELGLTAPEIYAADTENGFLLLEDLGDGVYGGKIARGEDMDLPYREAIAVLLKLSQLSQNRAVNLPDGNTYSIPEFDDEAFLAEAELLTEWFWKWLALDLPQKAKTSFRSLWGDVFKTLQNSSDKSVLALRDFHSPNLIWCEERKGVKRAGLIDFQDGVLTHPAYDLVSLLQDARTDIPPEVEHEYKELYLSKRSEVDDSFNRKEFERAYAVMGAQRNTKILGIFARLALRDNKPHYLSHIPRVLAYLERCLSMPGLESIKAWFDTYLPEDLRCDISASLLKKEVGQNAIILSAGLGKRMSPLSDTCPKPLIKICDKPLLEYALDKLSHIQAHNIVVNVHYLADQIESYLSEEWQGDESANIIISDERSELLETGGGIKKALPQLGSAPFFVMNSDSIWLEDRVNNLVRLIDIWDGDKMDCLILLAKRTHALGYSGQGDFELLRDGRLKRRGESEAPYVVSGTYLVHPRLFEGAPSGSFSMNLLWDKALAAGRLFGTELEGMWLHIGTPEAVEESEKYISEWESGLS